MIRPLLYKKPESLIQACSNSFCCRYNSIYSLLFPKKKLKIKKPLVIHKRTNKEDFNSTEDHHLSKLDSIIKYQNDAITYRNDPKYQSAFLWRVLPYDPNYVVRRFESGLYATDISCRMAYVEALKRLKNMNDDDFVFKDVTSSVKSDAKQDKSSKLQLVVKILEYTFWIFILYNVFNYFSTMVDTKLTEFDPCKYDESDVRFFSDVKGCHEAKEEFKDVVEYLRNPHKFTRLGARVSKGILMVGPPGTGKTLLARAVAGEAGVPFYYVTGSQFDEMFVGVGAARIKKLFELARKNQPCIVFIDELDALGGRRTHSDSNFNRQTLNQFLVELDGFKSDSNVIIIGATNFAESLDKALTRSGRFDSQVYIELPSYKERVEIFSYYMNKIKVHPSVSPEVQSNLTPGISGADICNLVNQAAQRASVSNKNCVTSDDFDWAREKISMGRERRSVMLTPEDIELTAYHEAGHAITAFFTENAQQLHKATIIPRGSALGFTQTLPDTERVHHSNAELKALIDVCMGGRAAEEIIYGSDKVTTGCSSDLERATQIARSMVMNYGMSQKIGFSVYNKNELSPAIQQQIDEEVRKILTESYERVKKLLSKYSREHKNLTNALIKHETLTGDDLINAINFQN